MMARTVDDGAAVRALGDLVGSCPKGAAAMARARMRCFMVVLLV
jgi:hypothetical protein